MSPKIFQNSFSGSRTHSFLNFQFQFYLIVLVSQSMLLQLSNSFVHLKFASRPSMANAFRKVPAVHGVTQRFFHGKIQSRWYHQTMKMSAKPLVEMKHKSVYAFDFDGVICDSEGETCISGYKAMMKFWPELARSIPAEMHAGPEWVGSRTIKWPENAQESYQGMKECPDWLKTKMRKLRPIVETGYENMLLERLCIEEEMMAIRQKNSLRSRPLTVAEIIANWDELKETLLRKYNTNKDDLIKVFASTRDEWIASDFNGWLNANNFYPVIDSINNCSCEKYVITTKDKRFASKLLQHAGCEFDEDKIYGLGSGPKADTLYKLIQKHNANDDEDTVIHFVEDKVETLEKICADPRLNDVRLYFATWGYNTADQAQRAKQNERITCINPIQFMELTSAAYVSSASSQN